METLQETSKLNAFAEHLKQSYRTNIPVGFARMSADASEKLTALEFPDSKKEYWKYTRTASITNKNWKFSQNEELPDLPIDYKYLSPRAVFVNGKYNAAASDLSSIEGFKVDPFSESGDTALDALAPYRNFDLNPFLALNAALPQEGYCMRIPKNLQVAQTVYIINVFTGSEIISQPRSSILMEMGSSLKVTEYNLHLGNGAVWSNAALETCLADNARLELDVIQLGNPSSYAMRQFDAVMSRDSYISQNTITLSGKWTRNNSNIRVKGENCTANLNGFYIPSGNEHVDNHTMVDHETPHCDSNELYRGVLLDKSTGVFNGKVYVRPDAQKTNAFQSNGNILVHDTATMNSKPELEIYADDVKCSHGSTTGQLDEEAMFYLRARGISEIGARKMLVAAFAADVLGHLTNEHLRGLIEEAITAKLSETK